ncbi:MAG: coenzyme hydrogenase subunit delta [Methanothermococcus sp.]|jgi:coenzyme F420 hydrogenase subunit delta|uniref:coenzyme F420-reducing hydrogenase, FrhD protein n=1 Tax=Methanothermococcus TaxID=155862 RepID=UPI000382DE01|nr:MULTISPECIES: coenzyme F420-reducing hydrogenase, FrhD protein [Methanothermococcus]MDK2789824.1 coenzyme hydrogenase subunit delta [Methanothermococcus sp.]
MGISLDENSFNDIEEFDLTPSYLKKKNMVLACGNILFADDGFSVHVLEKLNEVLSDEEKKDIALVDAGAGAPQQVLTLIDDDSKTERIVVVDVIDFGLKPGEIKILKEEDLPGPEHNKLDIHDWPLSTTLKRVCNQYGIELIVVGCQAKYISEPDVVLELSEEVEKAVDKAVDIILEYLRGN